MNVKPQLQLLLRYKIDRPTALSALPHATERAQYSDEARCYCLCVFRFSGVGAQNQLTCGSCVLLLLPFQADLTMCSYEIAILYSSYRDTLQLAI